MSKSAKSRKNKVPKIGEKEYAAYIDFLKTDAGSHSLVGVDMVALKNSKPIKKKN
jgi:hypothetical protein